MKPSLAILSAVLAAPALFAAAPASIVSATAPYASIGTVERLDPALDALLAPDAAMQKLAEGFKWSEGPIWVPARSHLLFSDVPENRVYRWKEGAGISVFLEPSGYTGTAADGRGGGSNGLALDRQGRLLLCQHGDRRIARLAVDGKSFETVVDRYQGRRLSSPNDLCRDRAGNLFFTDPPYGLSGNEQPEIEFNGVYRLDLDDRLTVIARDLERPNGIALSPDERTLYVCNSHGPRPVIMAYSLDARGTVTASRVFFDATDLIARTGRRGALDGLRVDALGNIWSTGPGGVLIISPEGRHLGSLLTGRATGNCTFGGTDGQTLFLTAGDMLLRIQTKVTGAAR